MRRLNSLLISAMRRIISGNLLRGTTLLTFENHLPGYKIYRVASRSLRALDSKHYLGTIYGFSNFVALRPDMAERLKAII